MVIRFISQNRWSMWDSFSADGRLIRMLRLVVGFVLVFGVVACTPRPGTETIYPHPRDTAVDGARIVTVYVATTREQAKRPVDGFTREREEKLSYAAFDISIPPDHKPGEIEWPYSVKAHPEKEFTVVRHLALTREAFEARIGRSARTENEGKAVVFVHGFNVSFQEALFREAQLKADSGIKGVPVLFSWPSQARVLDYVTDKESATFSRDGLTDVLEQLTSLSSVKSVMLFGHSMGGWLSMEAVRQLALTKNRQALRKLNVVLAAPDIDEDVFAAQVDVIGPLNPPILVLVSTDDRALGASRLIQGNRARAGQLDITDPEVVEKAREMDVTLLDISSVSSPDALGHSRYAELAPLYGQLEGDVEVSGGLREAGARIFDAVGKTIAAPFTYASAALDD